MEKNIAKIEYFGWHKEKAYPWLMDMPFHQSAYLSREIINSWREVTLRNL